MNTFSYIAYHISTHPRRYHQYTRFLKSGGPWTVQAYVSQGHLQCRPGSAKATYSAGLGSQGHIQCRPGPWVQ